MRRVVGRTLEVPVEQAHRVGPAAHVGWAPAGRRLLVGLLPVLLGGVLLVLMSSRPADAAERRGAGHDDPVGGTLAAATEPVGSLARGAAGTVPSTVGRTAGVARRTVAPARRPAARSAVGSTAPARGPAARPRGGTAGATPASPLGATAAASPSRKAARASRPAGQAAGASVGCSAPGRASSLDRALALVAGAGMLDAVLGPLAGMVGPLPPGVVGSLGPVLPGALGPVLAPGLLPLWPPQPPGRVRPSPVPPSSRAGPVGDLHSTPARVGPAVTVPPATVDVLPGAASAGPAGGAALRRGPAPVAPPAPGEPSPSLPPPSARDDAWSSPSSGLGLAAFTGVLFLFGLRRQGRVVAEPSDTRSRPTLPLVSPA
jgi:hypothetical protein